MMYSLHTGPYTMVVKTDVLLVYENGWPCWVGMIGFYKAKGMLFIEEAEFDNCKGKGLYRKALAFIAFTQGEKLYSSNRNDVSNAIWSHWLGTMQAEFDVCSMDALGKVELHSLRTTPIWVED